MYAYQNWKIRPKGCPKGCWNHSGVQCDNFSCTSLNWSILRRRNPYIRSLRFLCSFHIPFGPFNKKTVQGRAAHNPKARFFDRSNSLDCILCGRGTSLSHNYRNSVPSARQKALSFGEAFFHGLEESELLSLQWQEF